MKNVLLFVLASSFVINAFSQDKSFSRWSITAEYGYNYFVGDVMQPQIQLIPAAVQDVTFGCTLEYTLTPVWGLALDYYYLPLKGSNETDFSFSTPLHTGDLNATINFTRWIFPQTRSKFFVCGSIGIGVASYTPGYKTPDPVGSEIVKGISGYAGSMPVTLSVEYNISKPVALGAKVHYRAFSKDDLEGNSRFTLQGVNDDYVTAATSTGQREYG